ncbi:class I SAM-dependent rRNA methyltransferase [Alkalihalobacillus trypoxylicola]|uniref:50S rRNA methyltransferase n=1 Tax=Alkalihalobacillus trypoxylicola TaxID=519424 RepID=A0A162DF19_9BACI|nr:class I SAM-dependent rRNA methyltransferase [Alkalihalobacillus trypoxylicola]KYG29435.1 50S rRNA methyltransferase [Alkalihalobacillus trypoxylicola]
MPNEVTLKVKAKAVKPLKAGYPLLNKEQFEQLNDLKEEGSIIRLVDERHQFIAKAYYGKQNKGYGWVLSDKENEQINTDFFQRKLKAAIEARASLFQSEVTNAFRVFNAEGDGIGGVTIDYFDGYYLLNWYSKGIYQFKDAIIEALESVSDYKGIYEKKRFEHGGKYVEDDDFVKGEKANFPLLIKENGVQFAVYLNEGAMVGIFLDQREVRQKIREHYSKDKNVLNTFSYTGAFSVYAALGGASKTTSVDLANRSYAKTIEQFSLNEIDYESQDIIVEDVFKYFKYARKKGKTFDLVILDPPSFARSKKMTFSASKDYKNLLKEAIEITENQGVIVASTNSASFNMKVFKGYIDSAFKEMNGQYKIEEEYTLPSDFKTTRSFKEGNYLKVVFIRKL